MHDISEADAKSYVDRDSDIRDDSSIWRSKIIASQVTESVVSGSVIEGSHIAFSNVHGAYIENSEIAAEFIGENTRILNCSIFGKSRVTNGAFCRNVKFKDLTVSGSARLIDWNQEADDVFQGHHGYISRGLWTRPPRVFCVSPTITVTESVPGFAFMHCRERSIEFWIKAGHRYGAACGWTADQILAVRKIMHKLLCYKPYSCANLQSSSSS